MDAELIMTVKEMENRNAWLKMRTQGIGGSDASIIAGMNRWKSPFQLWQEKTGQVEPEELDDNEYIYWGRVLEQAVADRFTELTGKQVHKQGMLRNKEHPWMLANVDRMVVGEDAGLECKTTNSFAGKQWDGDNLPDAYYLQCQHYMMATGLKRWYIACLIGGNHFVWKTVERNEEDIQALLKLEKEFWEINVQNHVMPDVDGTDSCTQALRDRFPGCNATAIDLPSESEQILKELDTYKESKKQSETKIKELQNKLCLMLGDHEAGYCGDRLITWKLQKGRTTVDSKKLKTEQPDIFAKYSKVGKPQRVLRT